MSGTHILDQYLEENSKTPEERGDIQAYMLTAIDNLKGPEVTENDMRAFFGDRTDNSQFASDHTSGLNDLEDPYTRLTMARLYMIKQGHGLDVVFSQHPDHMALKEQMGKDFCNIIFSGNEKTIGKEWVGMTEYLNDVMMSPANLLDDVSFANEYISLAFCRDAVNAHNSTMQGDAYLEDYHTSREWEHFHGTTVGVRTLGGLLDSVAARLTDPSYSNANQAQREPLEGVLPFAGREQSEKNHEIFLGYKMLEEMEKKNAASMTQYDRSLSSMFIFADDFRIAKQANYGTESRIQPEDLGRSFIDLMDIEELSFDGAQDDKKLTAVEKPAREEISLDDFFTEVNTVKHTVKQMNIRETFKPSAKTTGMNK